MKRLWNSSTGGYVHAHRWWCLPCVPCPWFFLTPAYCTSSMEYKSIFLISRGILHEYLSDTLHSALRLVLSFAFFFLSVNDIWCTLDPGGGGGGGGGISRAVLTSSPPMPRQRQHGGGHYISAPTSSFVIEIVGAVLSSACFFFPSWGPHLTLPTPPPPTLLV